MRRRPAIRTCATPATTQPPRSRSAANNKQPGRHRLPGPFQLSNWCVARRLEREPPATVRHPAERAGITERLCDRHFTADHALVATRLELDDLTAPAREVADHGTDVLVATRHLVCLVRLVFCWLCFGGRRVVCFL